MIACTADSAESSRSCGAVSEGVPGVGAEGRGRLGGAVGGCELTDPAIEGLLPSSAPPANAAKDGPVEVVETDLDTGGSGSSGEINSKEGAEALAGGVLSRSSSDPVS